MTTLLKHDPSAVEQFTLGARRIAVLITLGTMLAGVVVAAWAGMWRTSAAGWRELAEQRAQQVEELNKRVGALETQVRNQSAENENLRRINLEYQQIILEMRRKVDRVEGLLRAER